MPGTTTLDAEITNVSGHCVWVLIDDEELAQQWEYNVADPTNPQVDTTKGLS